jgi:hypothetical protein
MTSEIIYTTITLLTYFGLYLAFSIASGKTLTLLRPNTIPVRRKRYQR